MTLRVRMVPEARWDAAKKPLEGWLWPADESSLKEQHTKTFRTLNQFAEKNELPRITPFVLYSFRHTFLTRLGQSACEAWTLARIAGHSSIAISSRYVHPSEDTVLAALSAGWAQFWAQRVAGRIRSKERHNAKSKKTV
jgi:integrase